MPIKWFRPALISSVFVLLSISAALSAQTAPLSPQEAHLRAEALLKQMTVEEKIGQMNQVSGVQMPGMGSEKPDDAIAKGQVGRYSGSSMSRNSTACSIWRWRNRGSIFPCSSASM